MNVSFSCLTDLPVIPWVDSPKDKDDKADMSSTMASTLPMAAVCTVLPSLSNWHLLVRTLDVYKKQVSGSLPTPLSIKYADGHPALIG